MSQGPQETSWGGDIYSEKLIIRIFIDQGRRSIVILKENSKEEETRLWGAAR